MLKIKQFTFNLFSENTIVLDNGENGAVIIDPGCYSDDEKNAFLDHLDAENIRPSAIFLTHGHPDHVYGVKMLQSRYDIPVYLHKDDIQVLDYSERLISKLGLTNPDTTFSKTWISDGQKISAAGLEFEVIHTPGHSPGCVCYYDRKDGLIFTGDTLFAGAIGRSDLFGGDYDKLIVSVMDKLMMLDAEVEVHPGHGGTTTIGYERMNNPFLEPFNEPEETNGD